MLGSMQTFNLNHCILECKQLKKHGNEEQAAAVNTLTTAHASNYKHWNTLK